MSEEQKMAADVTSTPDAVLEWMLTETTQGTVCALLTPAIKAKLRELAPGQVLEVRVNDLAAREDIAAWSRLAGHELLAMVEEPELLRAYLRKKHD